MWILGDADRSMIRIVTTQKRQEFWQKIGLSQQNPLVIFISELNSNKFCLTKPKVKNTICIKSRKIKKE
jgi:hypothetical protein